MSRPIDADYVLKALGVFGDKQNGDVHFLNGIETAREIVQNAPTIDAVPVVRCMDCEYWYKLPQYSSDAKPIGRCVITSTLKAEDGYCDKGRIEVSE